MSKKKKNTTQHNTLTGISTKMGWGGGSNQKTLPWEECAYFLEQHILEKKDISHKDNLLTSSSLCIAINTKSG